MQFFSKRLSRKILAVSILCVWSLLALSCYVFYRSEKALLNEFALKNLDSIGLTLLGSIDAGAHRWLEQQFPKKDDIVESSFPPFAKLIRPLRAAYKNNNLASDIYTLVLNEKLAGKIKMEPNRVHERGTEFILMSSLQPYYRHFYDYRPEMYSAFFKGEIVHIPPYEDQYGHWISTYIPIKNSDREVLAVLKLDYPLNALYGQHDKIFNQKLAILAGFSLLASLLIWLAATFVITIPLKKLTTVAYEFARGNYDRPLQLRETSENEVGILARALESFRSRLKQSEELDTRNWIKANVTGILQAIRGHDSLEKTAQAFMRELPKRMRATHGIFYLAEDNEENPQERELRIIAEYANAETYSNAAPIKFGNGLVGQCAVLGEPISLSTIPETYVKIVSGLGRSIPKTLLLYPMLFEGEVFGIIELASLHVFNDHEMAMLKEVTGNTAVILKSMENAMLAKRHLDYSRKIGKELRKANEELKAQSLALEEHQKYLQGAKLSVESEAAEFAFAAFKQAEEIEKISEDFNAFLKALSALSDTAAESATPERMLKEAERMRSLCEVGQSLLTRLESIKKNQHLQCEADS